MSAWDGDELRAAAALEKARTAALVQRAKQASVQMGAARQSMSSAEALLAPPAQLGKPGKRDQRASGVGGNVQNSARWAPSRGRAGGGGGGGAGGGGAAAGGTSEAAGGGAARPMPQWRGVKDAPAAAPPVGEGNTAAARARGAAHGRKARTQRAGKAATKAAAHQPLANGHVHGAARTEEARATSAFASASASVSALSPSHFSPSHLSPSHISPTHLSPTHRLGLGLGIATLIWCT